jgi:capsular exopolysaccharide synthesis family protein
MEDVRSFLAQIDNGVDPVAGQANGMADSRRRSHPQTWDDSDGIRAAAKHLPYNAGTLAASGSARRGHVTYGRGDSSTRMQPDRIRKLARRWAVPIVLLTLLGAATGYYVSHSLTPIYEAKGEAQVVAAPGQAGATGNLSLTPDQATTTAATLMTEPALLQKVIDQLHLKTTTVALATEVAATPQTSSELVDVTVHDPSAARAAQIANAVINTYVTQVNTQNGQQIDRIDAALQAPITALQSTLTQEEQQLVSDEAKGKDTTALRAALADNATLVYQLTLNLSSVKAAQAQSLEAVSNAAPATAPISPVSPNKVVNTALGGFVGFLLAIGLAAIFQYFDQGLTTADDVRDRLGLPCLAVVPKFGHLEVIAESHNLKKRDAEIVMEAYRRLRTNLLFSSPDVEMKSVVITSTGPGEGKTCTAANLAVALASSEKRVLLVDADMRNPGQHLLFHKALDGGLSELIMQAKTNAIARLLGMQMTDFANLSLLTSGTIPPNPAELLESHRARTLLTALAAEQDVLVIDTAPAGVVSDPLTVAAHASATILVVEAGKTNASQAAAVIGSLRDVGANVIGIVLNKAPRRSLVRRYGYSPYPYRSRTDVGSDDSSQSHPSAQGRKPVIESEAATVGSRTLDA